MTWIKLDDRAPRHPKIACLSDRAFRWWIAGLCYASEFLTDGLLPFTFTKQIPQKAINELRDARLWTIGGDGILIHDYLIHQSGRADIERERERNRNRKKTGGTAVPPRLVPASGTAKIPDPENREQRTENREQRYKNPPLPPSPRGVTREERKWALAVIQAYGNQCPHGGECESESYCVGRLVRDRASDEQAGRKAGAA